MEDNKNQVNQYRIVVFSENTFEELRSFKFRPWYLTAAFFALFFLIILLALGILALPPVRTMIVRNEAPISSELIDLREKLLWMEEETKAQTLYINNLRQLLSGEAILDTAIFELEPSSDSIVSVDRIVEDEILRNEIDLEERLNVTAMPRTPRNRGSATIEQMYLVPPVNGTVSQEFFPEKNHLGVDINAPSNTPVKATLSGYIIYSGWTLETGNTIGIQHEGNLISFYKHNSALLKKTGSFVQAGEAVAIIGNTGTLSTGPHLHFELWLNGKPTNPARYINFH